jgi:uncharacterized membrane protein YhiD involved in acid resistance
VRGLTTAASLWTVAAVGLAVGGGLSVAATTTTGLIVAILAGLKPVERRLFRARRRQTPLLILLIDRRETLLNRDADRAQSGPSALATDADSTRQRPG